MRGGRNKFGPMYKRDRARKLQVMRQRQLALQALRTSMGTDIKATPLSPGYQQAYPNMNIKQEIQIPQVRKRKKERRREPYSNNFLLPLGILTHTVTRLVAQPHCHCPGSGECERRRCDSHAHECRQHQRRRQWWQLLAGHQQLQQQQRQ